jgi:MFS family permease
MTVILYLIGTLVGPIIAGIFMQMYQTTIEGIVGSFPASQSYNSIFITSILMSMVSIVLFTVINKRTAKSIDGSIINTP